MIKQWRNENLGVNYFYLPNAKNGEILTSDGVLIPYNEFKSMTSEAYNSRKNISGGYDYNLSRQSERLVKKALIPNQPKEQIKIKKIADVPKVQTEKEKTEKKPFNLFDFAYPKLMIVLTIVCSLLSIYFTATYLQRLQSVYIAYSISTAMLIFGVVGFQIGRRAKKKGHKKQAFVYFLTSILVISFSMISSIDVNYSKFKMNHKDVEISYNVDEGKQMNYELIVRQIEDNKTEIERLYSDTEFQKTQYVLAWDNDLGKNVLIEGRISSTAQSKITENNARIEFLMQENKELNKKLMEYSESGVSMEKQKLTDERAETLTDLLGSLFHVSGNVIQLIFLLIPSFFVDIINLMAVSIYCSKFEEDD